MASKIRVYGRAMNRTALGIVHAYLVMYPNAKKEDFDKAFPANIIGGNWPSIFRVKGTKITNRATEDDFFFDKEDEVLTLNDGTVLEFLDMWEKDSFGKIKMIAAQYDIEIAEFERTMRGEKGGYRLEYLNGYTPHVPTAQESEKKGLPKWIWALAALAALALAIGAFLMGNSGKKTEVVKETVVVHDTIYKEKLEELETNFNAAKFEQGKSDLNDDAKFVLHDLAKLLEKNADVKLKIEGHTSAEGDAATNQKLSEDRAKATVDFLVSQGVDASRLQYEGFGSSKLKNAEDPNAEENRRTEFIVIQ